MSRQIGARRAVPEAGAVRGLLGGSQPASGVLAGHRVDERRWLAWAANPTLQRLECVQVLPLHKVDRSNLARRQLAGLHMPPRRDVRHPQFSSSFGQHHVSVISHALRIRPDVERITRNGLYITHSDRVKYVRRITQRSEP